MGDDAPELQQTCRRDAPAVRVARGFRDTRLPRLLAEEAASSRRSPRSINTRRGVRESTARFFARMSRSSGRSTVVFIQETIKPYSHIRQDKSDFWSALTVMSENRMRLTQVQDFGAVPRSGRLPPMALSACGRAERGSPPLPSQRRAA